MAHRILCSVVVLLVPVGLIAEDTRPKAAVGVVVKKEAKENRTGPKLTASQKRVQALVQRRLTEETGKLYADLQKNAAESAKALEAAGKAAKAGPRSAAEEARKLQEARSKLEAVLRVISSRQTQLRTTVTRTTVVRSPYRAQPVPGVRKEVDRDDTVERFLLLLPNGPLLVQTELTIDGEPFRKMREELVMKMLVAADSNRDGKARWDEALKDPRFTLGRVRILNDNQLENYANMCDLNQNDLVERNEARHFLARFYTGPTFALGSTPSGYSMYRGGGGTILINGQPVGAGSTGQAIALKLLDTDEDSSLSAEEIAAAAERLKSRDADDNDLLYANEITGTPTQRYFGASTRVNQRPVQMTVLLGPTARKEVVHSALKQHYGDKEGIITPGGFKSMQQLFMALDADSNAQLDPNEVLALNTVAPSLELSVDVQRTKTAGGFQVKSTSKDLPKVAETNGRLRIEFPGMTVEFETQPNSLRTTNYDQIAKTYVTRFDKNNNKYLEKDELAGGFAQQFAMWDADGDGKVFEKEIAESYTRMQAPQLSQIRATARSHGNPFFKAIDRSGDGRLSLREMKTAAERLKSFDKNKDGRISADEVPRGITLAFGVGSSSSRNFVVRRSTPAGRPAPPRSDAPDWFTRMDRNGDGDVTLKEFLGEREDFVRLDTNKDGFIEPAEAKAADAAGKKQKESSDDVDSE